MTKILDPQTDHHLISKAKQGDERAFTQLVKRYEQTVWGFAFKLCRDKEKAEESFQDTFINVYRKLDQFDSRSKFSTWLYTIAFRLATDFNRKENADKTKESQMGLAFIPSDQLVLSTWEATKRIASDFKQRSAHANHKLALVSQNELKKQLREVSNEGLRFVAQKLPQATVRMLGMQVNSNKGF